MTGAASDGEVDWHSIDWPQFHHNVRGLQTRIAKAASNGTPAPVTGSLREA
ncbi:MAG: reverse transcriptase N-terminal domain-containing protein [Deltaproteobacteria bacterium]|nr:reverse transcriptase N-terminal domain-containing protein [Deltaproteobacteria bacterium]